MTEDTKIWRTRANGGDSRYAIALGLMAIAEALKIGMKEHKVINMTESSLDDKFDTLIRVMEGMGETVELPIEPEHEPPPRNYLSFLTWFWRKH